MNETNAERIARMKAHAEYLTQHSHNPQFRDDLLWLIQQAEIVAGAKAVATRTSSTAVNTGSAGCQDFVWLAYVAPGTNVYTLPQPACGNENQGEKK